jgi:hypothetical protein
MDPRVTEFHCIMPMDNTPSVLQHGILSHERTATLEHKSVAMQVVQDRRDAKRVPGGLMLHHYANLYFHARNPMMFSRREVAPELCVLQVSTDVQQLPGVVFADANASSDYVRFLHPSQWRELAFDDIFALDWRHPNDPIAYRRHRSRKCAEVLVPNQVEPKFLTGAYVVDRTAAQRLARRGFSLPVTIQPALFFR